MSKLPRGLGSMDKLWGRGTYNHTRYMREWRAKRRGDVVVTPDGKLVGFLQMNRKQMVLPDGRRVY